MAPRPALLFALLLLLGGCCAVRGLEGPRPELSADEKVRVDRQVDRAMDAGEWAEAWNQAVDAGAPRERLEEVALRALGAGSDTGEAMLLELRDEYSGLTPSARDRAVRLRDGAIAEGEWERAVRLELLTADDAPAYSGAWQVYEQAPPGDATAILEAITEARSTSKEKDG